jgi:hypothetical protein
MQAGREADIDRIDAWIFQKGGGFGIFRDLSEVEMLSGRPKISLNGAQIAAEFARIAATDGSQLRAWNRSQCLEMHKTHEA